MKTLIYKFFYIPITIYFIFLLGTSTIRAEIKDTLQSPVNRIVELPDVSVSGYLRPQKQGHTPTSVDIITPKEIELQSVSSMVPVINTSPGVRMEERSPGSYRLSIRGSLVRSPYGIRNIKIYYNGFALTDAGGNTYLNVLNTNDIASIEILKGPDGSLFGANSGGVVLLNSNINSRPATEFKLYGGSFGLIGNSFHLARNTGKHYWTVRQSFQRADGYRQNTQNYRMFLQASDTWRYNMNNSLEAFVFYSDLNYKTPGGLTKQQYEENPRQARPATKVMPGSVEQKTRISTKMYFAGITHKAQFTSFLSHNISVWGNHVDFVYPFITNYEIRNENNLSVRTFLTLQDNDIVSGAFNPSLSLGFEGQRLVTDAYNYDNHQGVRGAIQAYNNILNSQYFFFLRGRFAWKNRFVLEAAVSLNYNTYHFRDTTNLKNNFPAVWMPHIALNYKIIDPLSVRFIVSRGYSNPSTAEIRPSDNKIHTHLFAEHGWNTEGGLRLNLFNSRMKVDATAFHYLLKDGIVSQVDSTGNTFFVNSGKIRQVGIEFNSGIELLPYTPESKFFRKIHWNCSYTFSYFHYEDYFINNNDYSGSRVAGIPRHVLINNFHFDLPANFYFFIQHNFTGKIPLNDANDIYADSYHLLSAKAGVYIHSRPYLPRHIFLFADNILNQKYSLGNDLNAIGGRYFNAAPTFNFQLGMTWTF